MKPEVLDRMSDQGSLDAVDPVLTDANVDITAPHSRYEKQHLPEIQVTMEQDDLENKVNGLIDTGQKCPAPAEDVRMATQIEQLQDMVKEMKEGFGSALEALAQIQYGDQVLSEKVATNKVQYEQQLGDVVQMVLSLKTEFTSVTGKLQTATENQSKLQRQVECLQYERDIMLEELERAGAISQQIRQKYHSGRSRPTGLNRSSDSTTLSSLLERAHSAFGMPNSHNVSDRDSGVNTYREHADICSCGDVTPPGVNPLVHSYIAGLQDSVHHLSSHGLQDSLHHRSSHGLQDSLHHRSSHGLHGSFQHRSHTEALARDPYDSDSSLTQAVNKSLDLSRSLGDKCAAVATVDSSEDEEEDEDREEDVRTADLGQENVADKSTEINKDNTTEKCQPMDQSMFVQPMTPGRIAPHERNTKEVQRLRVAREIMDTERKYCSNLWTILDLYVEPLLSSGILTPKETSIMFPGCLTSIYDQHCTFLQKLEERMSNWKYHSVLGDILCRFLDTTECDLLQQYQTYVADFPASLYQIRKSCKHTARFRKFLRMMQRHPSCEGLDIGSFMVTPIQRIPRYVLLLKQLLKHTDPVHPDHYHLETALERLADFLDKLNDSIEYSMRMVSSDLSPKPRRKLRIGSFRSTSVNSYDANSSKLNDTTMQGDDHSILSNSTLGSSRFFNFSFLRDSFRRKQSQVQVQVSQSYSTPCHSQVPPVSLPTNPAHLDTPVRSISHSNCASRDHSLISSQPAVAEREPTLSHSFMNGSCRDHSFSNVKEQSFSNNSLPVRSEKKKRHKHRRPRSGHSAGKSSVSHSEAHAQNDVEFRQQYAPSSEKRHCKHPRPQSSVDQGSESSYRCSTVTPQAMWAGDSNQTSQQTLTADSQQTLRSEQNQNGSTEVLSPKPNQSSAYEMAEMAQSLPDISGAPRTSGRKLPMTPTTASSMPKRDYGIFGDNDEVMAEAPCPHPIMTRVQGHSSDLGKARSASHVNSVSVSESPSQHYINMALARSLTENHLDTVSPITSGSLPRTSTSLIETGRHRRPQSLLAEASTSRPPIHKPRPHSARLRHVTRPVILDSRTQTKSSNARQNGAVVPLLLQSDVQLTPKKDGPIKRKKDRASKKMKDENLDTTLDREKKKGSLRESLKNIFFRKRGSRMLDIAPLEEFPENGHQVYSPRHEYRSLPTNNRILVNRDLNCSPRSQDPPRESVVVLAPVEPEMESYEDENGEPCSAV